MGMLSWLTGFGAAVQATDGSYQQCGCGNGQAARVRRHAELPVGSTGTAQVRGAATGECKVFC